MPASAVAGPDGVLTNNADNARTGFYADTQLSPSSVTLDSFGKIFSWKTDGQIYAQPLYVHGLIFPDASRHNIVYVATETNHVYALDADSHVSLWERKLGEPVTWGVGGCDHKNLFPKTGITSTPVIDVGLNVVYVVARTLVPSGEVVYSLHALDLTNGHDAFQPAVVGTTEPAFNPKKHLNRPGLLLSGGLVYIAFGSECDNDPYHGWVFAYSQRSLRQDAVFNSTPTGERGGIWQAGRGLVADGGGNVYLMTGNGTVDFNHSDVGESVVGLTNLLKLTDWFTPRDHACWNQYDLDLGSSGPLLLPSTSSETRPLLIGGGKSGVLFLLSSSNLGGIDHFHPTDEMLVTKPLHWLGIPCFAYLMSGGSDTHHIHGGPVLWPSAPLIIYNLGENDSLKAFEIAGNKIIFVASSKFQAPKGMPGGVLSVSGALHDFDSALVWATVPLKGDAVEHIVRGMLIAFRAKPVGSDLPLLWHSEMKSSRDSVGLFAKYVPPTIADGRVFVASFGDPADTKNADDHNPDNVRTGMLHIYGPLTTR